jgi:abhydrolase domain-containing protein 10
LVRPKLVRVLLSQCTRNISYKRLQTHKLQVGEAWAGRSIAYQTIPGAKKPTVVLVPGLHPYTHMQGHKSQCLQRFCDTHGYPCVVYDPECCGMSSGSVNSLLFSHWVEDAVSVVDKLTEGPVILVGASLGGWLALMAATQLKSKLHSLLLITPAVNYVWPYYNHYKDTLPLEVKNRLDEGDPHVITHEFGDSILRLDFAQDSRKFELDLERGKLDVNCPIRIVHGLRDSEVSFETSVKLSNVLESEDVDLILRKTGDHQMEQPTDLELILVTLDRLIKDNPVLNH